MRRLACVAALAAAVLAITAAPALAARPLVTGIGDGSFASGEPGPLMQLKRTGGRLIRIQVGFENGVVPTQFAHTRWDISNPNDFRYQWFLLDRALRAAIAAGATPVLNLTSGPPWAERCRGVGSCDPDPSEFAKFALAVARHYSGAYTGVPRVHYYMALNEPNLNYYFNPQYRDGRPISPYLYRALITAFANSVHSVNGDNRVVMTGLAPLQHFAGTVVPPLDFMRRMLCMKGRRHPRPNPRCNPRAPIDIWTTNPYTTGGPTHQGPGPDDVSLGDLPEMTRLLRASDRAGHLVSRLRPTPFWVLEFSWDSNPPDPHGVPLRIHARWASEALYRAWKAGVSGFYWFALRDAPPGGSYRSTVQGGLYFQNGRPKRTLEAFRFPVVAFTRRRGVFVWGRTPHGRRGTVKVQVWSGRRWRGLKRLRTDRFGIFQRTVRTRYGRRYRGLVRGVFRREASVPFSLRPVPDLYYRPFG